MSIVSADLLAKAGAKIVAVTDWKGAVYNRRGSTSRSCSNTRPHEKSVDVFPGADPLPHEQLWGSTSMMLIRPR